MLKIYRMIRLTIIICIFSLKSLFAQLDFSDAHSLLGTSFNYQWDPYGDNTIFQEKTYEELSLNSFFGIAFWEDKLMTGVRLGLYRNKDFFWGSWDNHYTLGIFQQIAYRFEEGVRPYIEVGLNTGNLVMRNIGHEKVNNRYYINYGLGVQFGITDKLAFDLGFINYDLLPNQVSGFNHNFTHFIIGIVLGKLKSSPILVRPTNKSVRFL